MKSMLLKGEGPEEPEKIYHALEMELAIIESLEKLMEKEEQLKEKKSKTSKKNVTREMGGHYRNTA